MQYELNHGPHFIGNRLRDFPKSEVSRWATIDRPHYEWPLQVLSDLIIGATYAFAAVVQPGQFQAYLISQTIANGWRRTVPTALSPILSDVPIICLVLLILTHVPPLFVHLLQVTGGLFLLYLASEALRACRKDTRALTAPPVPAHQTVLKAALVNLLNPNPYLAWALVMGPLLLEAWRQSPANGIALVGAFYLTMVFTTASIVILFAAVRSYGLRVAQVLVGLSAVPLACFGLYQLWSGSTELHGNAKWQFSLGISGCLYSAERDLLPLYQWTLSP